LDFATNLSNKDLKMVRRCLAQIALISAFALSIGYPTLVSFAADKKPTVPGPTDKDAPEEFTTTKSGLKYRILRKAGGTKPTADDIVKVHYKGTLDNGKVFDSSYDRGEPIVFPLSGVIKGWTEGMQYVAEGGMIELEIPSKLGYGDRGSPNIPGGSTLHFIVELIEVQRPVEPGAVDADAPEEFTETKSGLKYRIRRKSNGVKPKATSTVKVHYKGWLDSGRVFDSSYERREPVQFPLNRVIKGWGEGMQLIGQGGMIELDIPFELAYGEEGRPPVIPKKANLHFLVELVEVQLPSEPGAVDKDAPEMFTTTKSGLKYRVRRKTNGQKPTADSTVKVHYKGWLDNGKTFDSSYDRGQPIEFPLNGVIDGWTEGMQLIGKGGMIELEIPYNLAYGEEGRPPVIPEKATLHFIIELLEVQ
jgi:FKBP-type peptidyl-prolyl cis-trans isomerase